MGTNKRKKRALVKQIIFLVIVAVALVAGVKYYYIRAETAGMVGANFYAGTLSTDQKYQFYLEIASTQTERRKGLMFRKELDPDKGMIFIFPNERDQVFHMKNTFVSLDMVFIDAEFNVVGVLHSVPINNAKQRTIGKPSLYVVELLAGTAKKYDIKKGTKLKLAKELPRASS